MILYIYMYIYIYVRYIMAIFRHVTPSFHTEVERRKSSGQRRVWSFSALLNRCDTVRKCENMWENQTKNLQIKNRQACLTFNYHRKDICIYIYICIIICIRQQHRVTDFTWCLDMVTFLVWAGQMPNAKRFHDGTFYWTNTNNICWNWIDWLTEWLTGKTRQWFQKAAIKIP